jgi:hypothetical protein
MKISLFFQSVLKYSLAIFIGGIGLSVAILGGSEILKFQDKLAAKPYEKAKNWDVSINEILKFQMNVRTKLVDGYLMAQVNIDGYPDYLSDPRLALLNKDSKIFLIFNDKDGFSVAEKELLVHAFTKITDSSGKNVGLAFEFKDYWGAEKYASIEKISVKYTMQTQLPDSFSSSASKPIQDSKLDHCAPGLTKSERLKRLSQYGVTRQTGDNSFEVGYRSLTFFSDGSLLSCQ